MTAWLPRRGFLWAALGLCLAPVPAAAKEIWAGVMMDERARPAGSGVDLKLLGAGVFRFLFLRYYVCGLYVADGLAGAEAILARDAPRRVQLVALYRITSFEFLWGLDKGIADNMGKEEEKKLRSQLEEVREIIRDISLIAQGARVSIDYVPGAGTQISVDGTARGARVPGKMLNDALMRVWIGERPLDAFLKGVLLGG